MITDATLQEIDLVMVLAIPIHILPGHTADTIAKNANALRVIKRESTSREAAAHDMQT